MRRKGVTRLLEKSRETALGTACILGASALFSLGGLLIKLCPWPPLALNSGRSLVAALVIGIYMRVTRHKLVWNRSILLGALCICATTTLFVFGNKLTTAANAIVLQYTAPVFIIVLMRVFFRKKPEKIDLITCAFVFLGIILFFVDGLTTGGMLGNALSLLSGLTYAVVFMLGTIPGSDPLSAVFFGQLLSFAAGAPQAAMQMDFSFSALGSMLALGVLQIGLAYILFSYAVTKIAPVTASLLAGIEPILNPVLVAVFYGEHVGIAALCGAVIVLATLIVYNVYKAKNTGIENGEKKAAGT